MWDILLAVLVMGALVGMMYLNHVLNGEDDVDGWELW